MLTAELDGLLTLRDVVDLKRHVVKIEALLEQPLEASARVVAVGIG